MTDADTQVRPPLPVEVTLRVTVGDTVCAQAEAMLQVPNIDSREGVESMRITMMRLLDSLPTERIEAADTGYMARTDDCYRGLYEAEAAKLRRLQARIREATEKRRGGPNGQRRTR